MAKKKNQDKPKLIKPDKIKKRTKIVTTRFTEEEKALIDYAVREYKTSITDLMRKAAFYYIAMLRTMNSEDLEILDDPIEWYYEKTLKSMKQEIEQKIDNEDWLGLGISKNEFKEFLQEWKKNNIK